MIATLLTALFAFAGVLAIFVLADSARRHGAGFLALGKAARRGHFSEVRYTLITTQLCPVPTGKLPTYSRQSFSLRSQPSRLAA